MKQHNIRSSAFTLVELLVVIGIITVLMGILLPVASRAQESARRVKCAANLRQLGQAILAYSTNNNGRFPRVYFDQVAGTRENTLLVLNNNGRQAKNPFIANKTDNGYGTLAAGNDETTGWNNVPASIFLLLRNQLLTPEVLLCPSAVSAGLAQPDLFVEQGVTGDGSARTRSNFSDLNGLIGPTNLSYSIQVMYPRQLAVQQGFTWDNGIAADTVLAADMNPGQPAATATSSGDPVTTDVAALNYFSTEPDREDTIEKFNSRHHRTLRGRKEGQNVLYGDFHVEFQNTPFCGPKRNDIGGTDGPRPDCIFTLLPDSSTTELDKHVLPGVGETQGTGDAAWRPDNRGDVILLPTAN